MEQLRKLAVESSLDIPGATGYVDLAKSVTPGALSSKVAFLSATPADLFDAMENILSGDPTDSPEAHILSSRLSSLGTAKAAIVAIDLRKGMSPSLMNVMLSLAEERHFGPSWKFPEKTSIHWLC